MALTKCNLKIYNLPSYRGCLLFFQKLELYSHIEMVEVVSGEFHMGPVIWNASLLGTLDYTGPEQLGI